MYLLLGKDAKHVNAGEEELADVWELLLSDYQ